MLSFNTKRRYAGLLMGRNKEEQPDLSSFPLSFGSLSTTMFLGLLVRSVPPRVIFCEVNAKMKCHL